MKAKPNPLEVLKTLQSIDSSMLGSKKFVGFMAIQVCWTILLAIGINTDLETSTMNMMVGALGSAQQAFLGWQAWHDKHVKGDKMKAMNGSVTKAIEMTEEEPTDGGE